MRALMRRFMSLETRIVRVSGRSFCSAMAAPRIPLSGTPPGSVDGSASLISRVWKKMRPGLPFAAPLGSGRPAWMFSSDASSMSVSSTRLDWRAFLATSEMPFLAASSSSSTTMGTKRSCSWNRNSAAGSCISTFVSRTNSCLVSDDSLSMSSTGRYLTGAIIASRLRSSQKSMKSPRTDAIAESAGMPIVMCSANMDAPVCGAG